MFDQNALAVKGNLAKRKALYVLEDDALEMVVFLKVRQ